MEQDMAGFWVALTGFIVCIAILIMYFGRIRVTAKRLGARLYSTAIHLHGIDGIIEKQLVKLFLTDDKIVVEVKKRRYELSYDKLTAVKAMRQTDLIKQDKSVIGRGIVGGVLLGPLGAVIGGMSAVGKQKNAMGEFLIINYLPDKEANDIKVIIFDMKRFSKAKRFAKFVLNKRPELEEPERVSL